MRKKEYTERFNTVMTLLMKRLLVRHIVFCVFKIQNKIIKYINPIKNNN